MAEAGDGRPSEDPVKRRLEATAAAIGAVLAIGTLGVIVWDGVRDQDRPALVTLKAEATHAHEPGFVVEIVAFNSGDETAAALLVEGTLRQGDQVIETSQATFDYVPIRSERRGGLIFSQDPRRFELVLTAKGYIEP